ncbi:MAG TPA: thioredoxin domain-containing protein [Longimicrobium sp.]|jgi:protein-disulfide isomerase
MSNRLSNVFTALITGCALIITGLVVRRELFTPVPPASGVAEVPVKAWRQYATTGSHLGAPAAPLQIVEFSDFECPFCAKTTTQLGELMNRYPGQVSVVYRHYPLESIHPNAFPAAVAAECAAEQKRFRAYHDALFAGQDSIGEWDWSRFATQAEVPDLAAFRECVASERPAARIRADLKAGKEAGVNGTPAFIFDGKMMTGAAGLAAIEKRVAERIASK